jgi:alpha-L-fucosidase
MQRMRWLIVSLLILTPIVAAQHSVDGYVPETDPLVLQKLARWQEARFGLFMHWGIYSQWGIEASWSLCSEDMGWNSREKGRYQDYEHYKEDYRNLRKQFNPTKFNPAKWAKAAKDAGMRYMVLTSKHHDGFCMFDTKTTDFRITAPDCPFHSNPRANIAKERSTHSGRKGS